MKKGFIISTLIVFGLAVLFYRIGVVEQKSFPLLGLSTFQVVQGGTGATTLTGCLTGNGTGAITGTGSACASSLAGTFSPNSVITSNSAGTLIATGTQLTVGNLLATTSTPSVFTGGMLVNASTTFTNVNATTTFNSNILVSTTNDSSFGFNTWNAFNVVDNQAAGPLQINIVNRNTGASGGSGMFLGNANSTNLGFSSTYYAGLFMAGNGFALYPGVLPNDLGVVSSDSNIRFAAISANTSSSTMTWSVGPGFTSANYDMALIPTVTGKGYLGLSTSTPKWLLTTFASTSPQIALTGNDTDNPWTMRSIGNSFYLATASPTTWATSSVSAFSINANGQLSNPFLKSCDTIDTNANGTFSCGTDSAGGGFPFAADTNYGVVVYSTSTPTLWFKSGMYASSTSFFNNLSTLYSSSTIYSSFATASTTNLIVNGENFNDLTGTGLSISGNALTNSGVISGSCSGGTTCSGTNPLAISSFSFPWTSSATGFFNQVSNGTSTQIHLSGSPIALSASSTSVFDNASSTFQTIGTSLWLPSLTTGTLNVDSVGKVYKQATSTATISTGLTYSGTWGQFIGGASGNLTVNTSQNIATLSNLTTNGLVYTAGSAGTLNIAATTTLTGTAPIAFSQPISVIGGSASVITCAVATASVPGCLAAADFTTFNAKLGSYDAWTHSSINLNNSATTSRIGIGTTTPYFSLTVASSTGPQFSLSDTGGVSQWTFRNSNGTFYLATTTTTGNATSTQPAFSLNTNGFPTFPSLASGLVKSTNGLFSIGANGTDYTLISATTCGGTDKVSAISASGAITCSTDSTGGGAGSGLSTTTADYIIYNSNSGVSTTTYSLYTPTNTVISSSASADVVLRATIAHATSTIGNKGADIYVKAGTYYLNATTTMYGLGVDNDANTFKIWGAGQDITRFIVASSTDGFYLTNRVRVDFRNFSMFINGPSNAIAAHSGTSLYQSVWNSTFDGLYINSTSTVVSGKGFNMGNDYRNNYTNIQFYGVANCMRFYAEGNGLQTGDSVYSNIMCSTIGNTLSGTVAYDFDGTANSSANQVNDNTFIDVNAFANLGSKTAWRFKHALWMNIETTNPEGFSTTTEIYNNSSNNTMRIQYAIGSTTATKYFYADSTSVANVFGCQYIDSYNAAHTLFSDYNTDNNNPNILQGYNGSTCDMRGTGTFAFATTSASIIRDLDLNGVEYLQQVKQLGDRLTFNFSSGGNQYIKSDAFGLNLWNNSTAGLTVDTNGNVGIHNQSPTATLDVSGSGIISSNAWVTSTTGGWWLDTLNNFNVGYYRNAAGDSFMRTAGTPRFTIMNNGNMIMGTTTQTNIATLTAASATQSQLSLGDATAGDAQWTFRNAGGTFFLSTTTTAGTATSTKSALSITSTGVFTLSTTTAGCLNTTSTGLLYSASCSAGGAPTDADYLVGTANGSLSAEIVVGTSPGGELGGTWASPTLDDSVAVTSWNLTTPTITTSATMTDDSWIGFGSGSGRLEFDDQGSDELNVVNALLGVGTSTPTTLAQVTMASSTVPQLSLSNGTAGDAMWTMRSAGGNLYLSTTTTTGSATTSTAALSLIGSGKPGLGISTSTPTATLTVEGRAGDYNNMMFVGSTTAYMRIDNGGKLFFPSLTVDAAAHTYTMCGEATTFEARWDTTTCVLSAAKFKTNIFDLDIGLKELMQVRPVEFNYKPTGDATYDNNINIKHQQIGVIADEVEKIEPRLVTYDNKGEIKGFNYEFYTAWITKAVQDFYKEFKVFVKDMISWNNDQDKSLKKLEDQNAMQQKQIDELKAEIDELKK